MQRGFLKNAPLSKAPKNNAYASSKGRTPGVRGVASAAGITKEPVPAFKLPEHHGVVFMDRNCAKSIAANGSIMYTIPSVPKDTTRATHPDGWSECLTTPAVRQQILSVPRFPQPIPLPPAKSYRIEETPGRGTATIATRDLKMGDLIISERPILVIPRAIMPSSFGSPEGFTVAQLNHRALYEFDKQLELLLARADEGTREKFLGLRNSYEHVGIGKISGITRTNGYELEGLLDEELGPEDGLYSGTFHNASRLNHSCCPNTNHIWDLASFSMQIYAFRDIRSGEELTTHYNDLSFNAADRQEELVPHGFQCTCPACLNPSDSDPKREKVFGAKIPDSIEVAEWSLDASLPDTYLIEKSLDQIKLAREQGLGIGMVGPLHTLTQVYICLADDGNALRYGTLLQKSLLANTGKMIEYYTDIDYYRSLATWGMRKRLRPGMDASNTPVPFLAGNGELGVLLPSKPGSGGPALMADGMKRVVDMMEFWRGKGARYMAGLKPAPVVRGGNM